MASTVLLSYAGYALAVFLYWKLGNLFRVPMLVNAAFDVSMNFNLLAGWDVRWLIAFHGLAWFAWVVALTQSVPRSTFIFILLLDLIVVFERLYPNMQMAGSGPGFWNLTSTHIVEIWMVSITGVVASVVFRSTILQWWRGRCSDMLINPKKRFLLPIGAWAAVIGILPWLHGYLPSAVIAQRFAIAGMLLAWGWVLIELRFYLEYRALLRD